jgi:ribosomal protein S27AE
MAEPQSFQLVDPTPGAEAWRRWNEAARDSLEAAQEAVQRDEPPCTDCGGKSTTVAYKDGLYWPICGRCNARRTARRMQTPTAAVPGAPGLNQ